MPRRGFPRSSPWIYAGSGLFVLGFLIYANSLTSSFQFDDQFTIVNNPAVRQLKQIGFLFTSFNTRFITGWTFALNYQFGGLNVFGYHLVNTFIHILNALAVFILANLLLETPALKKNVLKADSYFLALGSALIFLAHPLQTQAVTYITQRASSLAAFFYLAALILYLRSRLSGNKIFFWAALITMVLGMFTKEMTFTIPFMLLAIEFFFQLGDRPHELRSKMGSVPIFRLKALWPFFVGLLIIPLTLLVEQKTSTLSLAEQVRTGHFELRNVLTEINVLRTYLRLLVLPVNQNLDYDYPLTQNLDLGTLFSFGLLAVLFAAGVILYKKNRLISFSIFWFFITTAVEAVVCSWVGNDFIFEHYLYLPMVGFALLVSSVLLLLIKDRRRFFAVLAVIIAVCSLLTYQRNKIWHDPFALWHDTAKKSPNKYRPYANLGVAYRRVGDYDKAIFYYYKSLSLGPIEDKAKAQIFVNLGAAYGSKGLYIQEIAYCEQAIKSDPYLAQAYSNIGYAYSLLGKYDQAIEYGEKAVFLSPYSAECLNNLGIAYAGKGDITMARELFEQALKFEPTHQNARQNLSLAGKLRK